MNPKDHEQAYTLLLELARKTSIDGHGLLPVGKFEEKFREVLQSMSPSASVISMAGSMQARKLNPAAWPQIVISALEDAFRAQLNDDLIANQEKLSASNDRLGKKMLFVAWVGVAVAIIGAAATLLPLLHK